jgi:hypothetical protein
MVNTADIRKHLEAVETAERHLDVIKAFAAKGGAYKLGITVDTKEAWAGADIAGIISQHLIKLPILESVEKCLKAEIAAAKQELVNKFSEDQQASIDRAVGAAIADIPQFLRSAK